ncbi:MAG: hypothetical protein RKP46_10185 [Candidatus Accumulibacter sp.]|uniref:hypothetical protein n=1 Tax=Accumulibacter sp. TaxID=2053492 RepID=UPI00287A2C9E|nr:hypothetical protein [Accumulibacter sp.]MDS4014709.1 hypothetical protein [Accumulibacter sp.]
MGATMHVSLHEAAALLGKTRRPVLYVIEQGQLPAAKVGGRWVSERSLLSADTAVQQRASQQEARLRAAVEEALTPGGKSRRHTFADLKAVQLATPIYREPQAAPPLAAAAASAHCRSQARRRVAAHAALVSRAADLSVSMLAA